MSTTRDIPRSRVSRVLWPNDMDLEGLVDNLHLSVIAEVTNKIAVEGGRA